MNRLKTLARNPWLLGCVAALMIYSLIGFSLVPFLVQHFTPKLAADYIKRPATVREVQFNPFLFALELKDVDLKEADGRPLFGLKRLYLDFDPTGFITKQAITLADLRIEGPSVDLVQDKDGKLNLAKIADDLPKSKEPPPPPKPDEPPPKLVLKHLLLADGSVKYTDEGKPTPATVTLDNLGLELNDLSTLPNREGVYSFDAGLPDGGKLAWKGGVALNPVTSAGELKIESFKLATPWQFIRDQFNLAQPAGEIGLSARYKFSHIKEKTELTVEDAAFKLAGLGLAVAEGNRPLLEIAEIGFDQARVDLAAQTVTVPSFTIRKGAIHAALDESGQINWLAVQKPAPPEATPKPTAPAAPPPAPWKVKLEKFEIAEIALDYADASHQGPSNASVGDFGLAFTADAEAGAGAPKAKVDGLALHLNKIAVAEDKTPLLDIAEVGFDQSSVDLAAQTVHVPSFFIRKGSINAGMDASGRLNWLGKPRTAPAAPAAGQKPTAPPAPPAKPEPAPAAAPWKVKLDKFEIAGIALNYADASRRGPSNASVGDFGMTLGAEAEAGAGEPKAKVDGLGLHLNKIAVADGKTPLLDLAEIGFDKAAIDLAARTVDVPAFAIRKGKVRAAMDEAGRLNWLGTAKPAPAEPAKQPEPPARPVKAPGDKTPPPPPWKARLGKFEISEIGLEYADASHKGPFTASVGDFGLALGAQAEAGSGAPKAKVDGLTVHVDRIALAQPGRAQPLFGLDSVKVDGGSLDLEQQRATVQRVALKGGGTAVVREADGRIQPLSLFEPKHGTAPAPAEPEKQPAKAEWKPWHVAVGEFGLDGFCVGITDLSFVPALAYNLDDIRVSAKSIANEGRTPVRFDTRLKVRHGGAVAVSGSAAPTGDSANAKIKVDHFDLKQLDSIVGQFARLKLQGADVSTDLAVDFKQAEPKPKIKATGKADLTWLKLALAGNGNNFLSWKNVGVSGIDFSLAPDKLAVKEVNVQGLDTGLHIYKDRSTNVAAIVKSQPAAKPASEPAKTPAKPAAKAEKGKPPAKGASPAPFPVSVARIRVDGAELDFADDSLVLPFATHISQFGGAMTGLSLAPKSRAELQFAGRVGDYGEAKVSGTLSPMDIKNFSNIRVVFGNVAMVPLSPYSATFAGRKIESGKVNLDLLYRIENSQLKSQNDIMLENFTLGARVESPGALDLPLDLAISLLTDSEGRIRASVPIEGDVDNPKFAIGTVIWDAFATLIRNVATAPFNALASVFGGDKSMQFDAILFEPGRDTLPPPEQEKLQKIGQGLAQRPKLRLSISGRFDTKVDGGALKAREVRTALARKLDVELQPGEEPDAPAFTDSATQRALEKLADDRGNLGDGVQAQFIKDTGKAPQRVGAMAGLTGKASETPEFYEKLYQALVDATPLAPSELEALGNRRSQAAMGELVGKNRADKARISLGKTGEVSDSSAGSVATKLELAAD